jgi:hypothetical protein
MTIFLVGSNDRKKGTQDYSVKLLQAATDGLLEVNGCHCLLDLHPCHLLEVVWQLWLICNPTKNVNCQTKVDMR